jgi:hypothetical protein
MVVQRSLFQSQRTQERVIAAVMVAVLLASLSAAYALGRHRHAQAPAGTVAAVGVDELHVQVPGVWASQPLEGVEPPAEGQRVVDTRRPTRVLSIVRVPVDQPVSGTEVLQAVLPRLMPEGVEATLETAGLSQMIHPSMRVVEWVGASQGRGESVLVHMAAALTRDGRVHWLLYLKDGVGPGEDPRRVLQANLGLLRVVLSTATIRAPAGTPGTGPGAAPAVPPGAEALPGAEGP